MTHEDIVESVAYERGINKYKTNYSRDDIVITRTNEIVIARTNEIVVNWVKENHPEVIEKIIKLVEDNTNEKDAE